MIVLLGGTGYFGQAYQRFFLQHGIPFRCVSRREVDYTQPDRLARLLADLRPEFLINCAGYTGAPNVDACELHKTECLFANAVLPGRIAEVCADARLPWGHLSSGCIYNGSRPDGTGFTEQDPPNFDFRHNNCSFYSGCKALAEEILREAPQCYLWRGRIPFNHIDHPRNYLTKLMRYDRLLDARNSLSHLDEFVRATWECWHRRLPFGIYNVTNPGSVTTREVVDLILASGVARKTFQFFASEEEFMRTAARAPRSNCVLDPGKILRAGIHLTEVHEAIRQALASWVPSR